MASLLHHTVLGGWLHPTGPAGRVHRVPCATAGPQGDASRPVSLSELRRLREQQQQPEDEAHSQSVEPVQGSRRVTRRRRPLPTQPSDLDSELGDEAAQGSGLEPHRGTGQGTARQPRARRSVPWRPEDPPLSGGRATSTRQGRGGAGSQQQGQPSSSQEGPVWRPEDPPLSVDWETSTRQGRRGAGRQQASSPQESPVWRPEDPPLPVNQGTVWRPEDPPPQVEQPTAPRKASAKPEGSPAEDAPHKPWLKKQVSADKRDSTAAAVETGISSLGRRPMTCHETSQKLRERGFTEQAVQGAINRLKELDMLDDARYTASYIRSKWRASQRTGYILEQELTRRGVAKPMIKEALEAFFGDQLKSATRGKSAPTAERQPHNSGMFAGEVEGHDLADDLVKAARSRLQAMAGQPAQTQARRLSGWLQRRGHDWDTIKFVLKSLGVVK